MTASLLSRETQVVLLSAGGARNNEAICGLWKDDLSLKKLLLIAQWERATPVLWRQICTIEDLAARFSRFRNFEVAATVWEFRLLQLESRLLQIADIFKEQNIRLMPLKGSGVAYTIHDGFTSRPMNDLDLLVPVDQAMDAWQLARASGWVWDADKYPLEKYALHHHLPPLTDDSGSGVCVEIHTELNLPGSPFDYFSAEVWADSRAVHVQGRELTVPSLPHQMLYTCIHFAWGHAMKDKAWITFLDIAAFVDSGKLDWDRFVALARRSRADTCAFWTLQLARSLAGVPVPDEPLAALRPRIARPVVNWLERQYTLNMIPPERVCPSAWLEDRLFQKGIQRGKHIVEMHEFKDQNAPPAETDESAGIWPRLLNHLKGWERWLVYVRMTVFGRPNNP